MNGRIEHIWAWISVADNGDEGVIAFKAGEAWMPLVASDIPRAEAYRGYAEMVAESTGRPVLLVTFFSRTVIERLERGSHADAADHA